MATTDPGLLTPTPAPLSVDDGAQKVVGRTPWQLFWLRFKQDHAALMGVGFILLLIVVALTAPLVAKYVIHHLPNDLHQRVATTDTGLPKIGPSKAYWFGADKLGRDVFVRTIYGARTSLTVALIATSIALMIGITLGMVAGFFRKWIDTLISRFADIMLAMPLLVFGIGIASACSVTAEGCLGGLLKPGLPLVIFIIALFSWTYIARIIRGQTLSVREREFVEAARSIGSSNKRIMFREILPNLIAPIIIYATLVIPANISFEAYLSYFGLGAPPSTPSWGAMIADAQDVYTHAWWMMLFPGLMLLFTTLAFNLLGDGLRDALDPKTGR
ncbi:MAG: ABC transporter permease [Actinomycetota bacterium]